MRRAAQAKRALWRIDGNQTRRASDRLAVEEPLEIQLRAGSTQRTLAITMRTPGDDYDLVAGFLYAEGLIANKYDISQMLYCVDGQLDRQEYNVLRVTLNRPALPDLPQLDRYFFTNSACGVCGRAMLDDLDARALPPLADLPPVDPALLAGLPDSLRQAQRVFDATGGLHAAALFDLDGTLLALREDVGRHNALDKLLGWGVREQHLPFSRHIVMVSGRASYELLHKCRVAGAAIFCAVSAPSSLAADLAQRFGITLVGFLRGPRFNIYTHPERIRRAEDLPQSTQGTQSSQKT